MSKNFVSYQDALSIFSEYAEEINKSIKKFSVMPNYMNFELGTIIQYVGDDSGDYVNGYFYERTASGWVQKNTQPTASGLGTAAFFDVAESGDAASNEVVTGDDSRLSDSRPASDVPSWAKQSTKPTYNKSEVGLANVDNTSDATKKTNFTGSIADGNTGFATGGDVYTALGNKVDKVTGKRLSTNDYTDEDKEKVDKIDVLSTSVSGNPLSFTTKSAQLANNAEIVLEPIQTGIGDPSPTNVRAISGYDKVEIKVTGKNLIESVLVGYGLNSSGNINENAAVDVHIAKIYKDSTYIISNDGALDEEYVSFFYTTPTGVQPSYDGVRYGKLSQFTAPIDGYVAIATLTGVTKEQLELGSTATEYEPYNPATDITLNLPEIVYGGKLNVEKGEINVGYRKITVNSDWTYAEYSGKKYITYKDNDLATNQELPLYCNMLIYGGIGNASVFTDGYFYRNTTDSLRIPDSTCSSLSDFLTKYNGCYVVYPIEPYTIQLTPHQVKLLLGSNVVTTNGTTINLDYNANGEIASLSDLSGVGESINALSDIVADNIEVKANKTDIAYVESGTTASKAYSEGDMVYVGGVLYKVLTAISSGQLFTIGTNVAATSIDTRLKEINTQLQQVLSYLNN